ncbi:MAG: tRNA (guanosine(37)-N1)-methyltransferase TrmD [Planctomycetia bacterium]|nr:tRNA (guanosine(37)-N1)-methyltransferase TrmD [Planctomycetia bacterium]
MRFDVLTLFPGIFDSFVSESILKGAIDAGLLEVCLHNIRNWATDKHQTLDDRPFGGGPGMVLKVDRVVPCVEEIMQTGLVPGHLIMLSPQGRTFTQRVAEELAAKPRLVLLCGRYEGFDQRIIDILQPDEVSIGDYVLNGGEVAAMAMIETVMRLIPGVLGDADSALLDSFSSGNRLLKEAQYTRPREYRGLTVPDILISGDHQAVDRWRAEERLSRTQLRRPDLLTEQSQDCPSGPDSAKKKKIF